MHMTAQQCRQSMASLQTRALRASTLVYVKSLIDLACVCLACDLQVMGIDHCTQNPCSCRVFEKPAEVRASAQGQARCKTKPFHHNFSSCFLVCRFKYLKGLITLSTPWEGSITALKGTISCSFSASAASDFCRYQCGACVFYTVE